MKIKNLVASIAAAAMAVSMMSIAVDATNWQNASYADEDPNTVKIVSTDENKVVFTQVADAGPCKCRITVGELLEEADAAKVKSATWTITYEGVSDKVDTNGLGGGTYFGMKNSTGYWVSPDYDDAGNAAWNNTTYTATDSWKGLLPTEVLKPDMELVFIDWSNNKLASAGVTVSVSDLKFFDADGNEIAQKPYGGAVEAAPEETTATEEAADAPADDEEEVAADGEDDVDAAVPEETTAAVTEEVVTTAAETAAAADTTTTPAATGNVAVASVAAVMVIAGTVAIASKKRK